MRNDKNLILEKIIKLLKKLSVKSVIFILVSVIFSVGIFLTGCKSNRNESNKNASNISVETSEKIQEYSNDKSNNKDSSLNTSTSDNDLKNNDRKNLYFSVTSTGYNNKKNQEQGMTTKVMIYDFDKNTSNKEKSEDKNISDKEESEDKNTSNKEENIDKNINYSFAYTSQYPLSVADLKENKIYYTEDDGTGDSDQVFSYNLKTKESNQLTKDFFAINKIIPQDESIIVVGVKKAERPLKIFSLDKKTNELKEIKVKTPSDFSCWLANYNPITKKTLFLGWSEDEKDKYTDDINNGLDVENKNYKKPKTYVYELDESTKKLQMKFSLDGIYFDSVIASDLKGDIILGKVDSNFPLKDKDQITWYKFHKKTSKLEKINFLGEGISYNYKKEDKEITRLNEEFYFVSDNEIVFRGFKKGSNKIGVYLYNLDTKKVETVTDEDELDGSFINNFTMLFKKYY
ncbi:MAG: hypothetical protein LBR30_07180 [Clostridioides sp.]|jgi:hypothetical protein|nr:hypothetical protein [Clostridioides sp.]